VYALDSYGQSEKRLGRTGEVLKPVGAEGAEEEESKEGGSERAQELARAEHRKWRSEGEEHMNWTDGDGTPHPLYTDARGDLCYLDGEQIWKNSMSW